MSIEGDFKKFECAISLVQALSEADFASSSTIRAEENVRRRNMSEAERHIREAKFFMESLKRRLEEVRDKCAKVWKEDSIACEAYAYCECYFPWELEKDVEKMIKTVDELLTARREVEEMAREAVREMSEIKTKLTGILAGLNCTTTIKAQD